MHCRGNAMCKRSWQVLKKMNMELPCEPAIPHPGVNPRDIKIYAHMETYRNVHSHFICNGKKVKMTQMSTNR